MNDDKKPWQNGGGAPDWTPEQVAAGWFFTSMCCAVVVIVIAYARNGSVAKVDGCEAAIVSRSGASCQKCVDNEGEYTKCEQKMWAKH